MMAAFVPDGYVDSAGALRMVIESRFPDEARAIDEVREHFRAKGQIPPNLAYRERQLVDKAEPVLRSILFKGSVAAVAFDEDGEISLPAHHWATANADGVLLSRANRMFFSQSRLRSALHSTGASIVPFPRRTRGRQPAKLLAVKTAMIAHGDMADLAAMTEEAMASTFDASRETCRKARAQVLSDIPRE